MGRYTAEVLSRRREAAALIRAMKNLAGMADADE